MREKLALRNNRQFQIDIYKGEIEKAKAMILVAPKRKKKELEQKLQDLNKSLSSLKTGK